MTRLYSGIAVLVALGASHAQGLQDVKSVVVSRGQAYALLPPVAVAPSGVQQMLWSPNGMHLAIIRKETILNESTIRKLLDDPSSVKTSTVISIWSARTQQSSEVKRLPLTHPRLEMCFLADSDALLITVEPEQEGTGAQLLRYSVGSRRLSTLFEWKSRRIDFLDVEASPTIPIAVVMIQGGGESTDAPFSNLHTVGATGGLSPAMPAHGLVFQWSRDGRSIALVTTNDTGREKVFFDVTSFATRRYDASDILTVPDPLAAAGLRSLFSVAGGGRERGRVDVVAGHLAAVEPKEHATALVAAEIDRTQFHPAPDLSAIAYVSEGVGLVRPIMKLTASELEGLLAAEERIALLSDAKQIATAVQMFQVDHDDRFPDHDRFVEQVSPYLKNNDALSRFVYTFQGSMADITDPSKTPIGYIEGPGGRAVAYADGSARWIKH
ncbi:MAG TPA: hypothetical protein PLH94_08145 [Fimbriimonadaceae bacterium]|nr:hypothetical protein [Fimbriimonadaceae bacterium]